MCENVDNFARMKCLMLPWNINLKKKNICIVCGNKSYSVRLIKSKANTDIGLKELFKKYGGICVASGILCRNCFHKLINFDKKSRKTMNLSILEGGGSLLLRPMNKGKRSNCICWYCIEIFGHTWILYIFFFAF